MVSPTSSDRFLSLSNSSSDRRTLSLLFFMGVLYPQCTPLSLFWGTLFDKPTHFYCASDMGGRGVQHPIDRHMCAVIDDFGALMEPHPPKFERFLGDVGLGLRFHPISIR
jgi:hypothetical protein